MQTILTVLTQKPPGLISGNSSNVYSQFSADQQSRPHGETCRFSSPSDKLANASISASAIRELRASHDLVSRGDERTVRYGHETLRHRWLNRDSHLVLFGVI